MPENEAFRNVCPLNDQGYIQSGEDCLTATPGVFAAGDCTGAPLQIAKAVGEGHIAALSACEYLDKLNG